MTEDDLFKKFLKSGSIYDYLKYAASKKEEPLEAYNRRFDNSGDEGRGERPGDNGAYEG